MALLTFGSTPSKGGSTVVTLNKSEVLALPSVAGDAFWSVSANIKSVIVVFKSTSGKQDKNLYFDFSQATPTSVMTVSGKSRDQYRVYKLVLTDFDGDNFTVLRDSITSSANYDVNVAGGSIIAAAGAASAIAKKSSSGNYVAWGYNTWGNLGNNKTTSISSPTFTPNAINFSSISGSTGPEGQSHFLGIESGTNKAYAWGYNNAGMLLTNNNSSALTTPSPVNTNVQFQQVSAGHAGNASNSYSIYCLGLEKDTGYIWSWGYNYRGNLGLGDFNEVSHTTVEKIPGTRQYSKVFAGNRALAIESGTGYLYAWGRGVATPTLLSNTEAYSDIAGTGNGVNASNVASFAISASTGKLYSWGDSASDNANGIYGDGSGAGARTTRAEVSGGRSYSKVSAGSDHAAAIEASTGDVYCWGANSSGQLGDGTTTSKGVPTKVSGGIKFSDVYCGNGHTIGVEAGTGEIYVWGKILNTSSNNLVPTKRGKVKLILDANAPENPTTLAMDMEGSSVVDRSSYTNSLTATGATLSSTQAKFGSNSLYFSAQNDRVTAPIDVVADIVTKNFTIEGWYYFTANNVGYQALWSIPGSADGKGVLLTLETDNSLYFYSSNGSSWTWIINTFYQPVINQWIHIAVVRNGNTVTVYVNGVSKGSVIVSSISGDISNAFHIGNYPYYPGSVYRTFRGYMDDFRITMGVARYTGNFSTSLPGALTNGEISDTTGPAVGVLSSTGVVGSTVILSWTAATDTATNQADLLYKVVYSTGAISDMASAVLASVGMDWSRNTLNCVVSGLANTTNYNMAVLVMDNPGNKSLYSPISVTTQVETLPAGYIAKYTLNGNANDSSGNGYDGVGTNVTYTTGRNGAQAASFNGSSSKITAANVTTSLTGSNAKSMSAWVKLNTLNQGTAGIVGFGTTRTDGRMFYLSDSGYAINQWFFWGFGSADIQSGIAATIGTWYHLAVTYSGATTKLYLNGSLIGSKNYVLSSSSGSLTIGYANTYLNGLVQDVLVYDKELTSSQVTQIYNAQL